MPSSRHAPAKEKTKSKRSDFALKMEQQNKKKLEQNKCTLALTDS